MSSIHYSCSFELLAAHQPLTTWQQFGARIRSSLLRRLTRPSHRAFGGAHFFDRGDPATNGTALAAPPGIMVGQVHQPDSWSVQLEYPCEVVPGRLWKIEAFLIDVGESHLFSLVQTYRYAHDEQHQPAHDEQHQPAHDEQHRPAEPMPTVPAIVRTLIESPSWIARSGSEVLGATPQQLHAGQAEGWLARLADRKRCPLVLVSSDPRTGWARVDVNRLARLLTGAAVVVAAPGSLCARLSDRLPDGFDCRDGAVRVYEPALRLDEDPAELRDYYFSAAHIGALGARAVEARIARAVARRISPRFIRAAAVVGSMAPHDRNDRLVQLRRNRSLMTPEEWAKSLEEDYERLDQERTQIEEECQRLADQLDVANQNAENAALRETIARQQASAAQEELKRLRDAQSARFGIEAIPDTVADVVAMASGLFADRMVFTDEARRSAESARIGKVKGGISVVWSCLRAMATHLHELHFASDAQRLDAEAMCQEFYRRTTFKLTLTESRETKRTPSLMAMRRVYHNGREIDIKAHVKYGIREPDLLRVHYCPDQQTRRLIIGHCGDHLPTYRSKKL